MQQCLPLFEKSACPFVECEILDVGVNRYSDLRNDWLAGEDVARDPQTNYTMRVERIPRAFRSPAILQKFFSTLFPGQVCMCVQSQESVEAFSSHRARYGVGRNALVMMMMMVSWR